MRWLLFPKILVFNSLNIYFKCSGWQQKLETLQDLNLFVQKYYNFAWRSINIVIYQWVVGWVGYNLRKDEKACRIPGNAIIGKENNFTYVVNTPTHRVWIKLGGD